MTWEKAPAWTGPLHQGCGNAPGVARTASLDLMIAVGFGQAQVTRDDELIFEEHPRDEETHYLAEFEALAQADPDHDWRVRLNAPLRDEEYQRHGPGQWVLIQSGPGFA